MTRHPNYERLKIFPPARQSETRCLILRRNSDSFDSFKRFMETILFSRYYSLTSALEVIFIMRCAI